MAMFYSYVIKRKHSKLYLRTKDYGNEVWGAKKRHDVRYVIVVKKMFEKSE